MPTAQKRTRLTPEHKKRHGHHHSKGPHYVKVYWPYLPLLLIIVLGSLFSFLPSNSWDVLAYASNLSHESLLQETNEERSAVGQHTLALNDKLSRAAQAKANDMAAKDYWSHTTPDGQEPWVFVVNAGYEYKKAGENLAYGFRSSEATISGWMNSPSHKDNLLDSSYTEAGFGYANSSNYQGKGEVTIVVAMYGNPLHSPTPVATSDPSNSSTVSTQSPVVNPAVQPVSILQASSNGRFAWLSFAIGLASGVSLVVLVLKHGLALRKLLVQGEAYFLHHPVFDLVLLSMAVIGILLTRTAGFII
jgi:uncharacterized protein YkwD